MSNLTITEQLQEKYPNHLIENVRQRLGVEVDDVSQDKKILNMSKNTFFKHVVNWEGLLGSYDETIKSWVNDIYGIDLDEVSEQS